MASHTRVTNLTDGRQIKRSQALRRISECLSVWVEEGFTIRDLTVAERIHARAEKRKFEESLEPVEPRLAEAMRTKFVPPENARPYLVAHKGILCATRQFYNEARSV